MKIKPGTASKAIIFVCGRCEIRKGQWNTTRPITLGDAQRRQRQEGWSNTKEYGWVCPACNPKGKV